MRSKPRVGIIGPGNIGRELHRKLVEEEGWNIEFVADVDGVFRDVAKKEKICRLEGYLTHAQNTTYGFGRVLFISYYKQLELFGQSSFIF